MDFTMDFDLFGRLGITDAVVSNHLVDFFNVSFRFNGLERREALVEFCRCVIDRVEDLELMRNSVRDLRLQVGILTESSSELLAEIDQLKSGIATTDAKAFDLITINAQLKEAITAFKEKTKSKTQLIARKTEELETIHSELTKAKEKELELTAENALLKTRITDGVLCLSRNKKINRRLLRDNAYFRRGMMRALWSKHIQSICRRRVEMERGKAAGVRVLIMQRERDDAIAEKMFYSAQNIDFKARLTEFIESKRVARAGLFLDPNGREKICPVPTVHGVLVPLSSVYSGWAIGGTNSFVCPYSGVPLR